MNRAAGFSLIELMCAILILGIGVLGISHGITTALQSSKESELQSSAALLAAGRIETLRAEGFIEEGEDSGEFDQQLALYRWRQTITPTDLDGLYDLKVTIENAKSGADVYSLETLLFEPPLPTDSPAGGATGKKESRKKPRNL
jgi:prepilin-type N-terminal cleavage/methylation domain-containing protein